MLSRTRMGSATVALLAALCLPVFSQSPTFRTETYPAATNSYSTLRTDLNRDGALDFVMKADSCDPCLIVSNGDGSYRPPVSYNSVGGWPVGAGDINGDGK